MLATKRPPLERVSHPLQMERPLSTSHTSVKWKSCQMVPTHLIEVYPVVLFTRSGGTLPTYNRLTDAAKASLLPLPPLSFSHPAPDAFGARLNFGIWRNSRDSFLLVNSKRFIMPTTRPVSLSFDHLQFF